MVNACELFYTLYCMKISIPQLPSAPAEKPAEALPRQDNPDLEEDAALFRQSLDENQAAAENQPGARRAGPEHGAEARYQPGAAGARRHERHGAAVHHHEHGATGAHPHEPGATGAHRHEPGAAGTHSHEPGMAGTHPHEPGAAGAHHHEPGAAGTHSHEPGMAGTHPHEPGAAGATQQQKAINKPAPDAHKAGATAQDDVAAPAEADDKDRAEITETGQDLYQFMAVQETRSHEIAAQQAGEVSQPIISQELVDKVADRILVSVGHDGQDREVRILVKDSVLQNTEVSLKYEQGDLVVNFITQSATDNALLNNSSQAIKTTLEKALDGGVRVNVSAETDDAGNTRDDRRSRGMYIDEEESN